MNDVVANAKIINIHDDKYAGTLRADRNIKNVYVFLSAYKDGADIVPVEFNVKELPNVNKIYMTVTMTKIKEADIMAHPPNLIGWERANQLPNYNVAQIIKLVNSSEGEFFKYIPDALLVERTAKNGVSFNNPVRVSEVITMKDGDIRQNYFGENASVVISIRDNKVIQATPQKGR